jgi:aminoglycoside phosphotransferase (APT) family kinase protein
LPENLPLPCADNFYRGGSLSVYDGQFRDAVTILARPIDANQALKIWVSALATTWTQPPVWVHGDIALGNLLMRDDRVCAVIDFGQL